MNESECYSLLSLALSFDEHGNKKEALKAYSDAVEAILKLPDGQVKDKLRKYASNALERAETLQKELNVTEVSTQSPENPPLKNQRFHSGRFALVK